MKKTIVLAIALLTAALLLGFFGQAQPAAVTAKPLPTVRQLMPLIIKDFDSSPPGPTPIQITQELLAPTVGTPSLGDSIVVHVGISNTGSKAITQLPVELFFDTRFLSLMIAQPHPTTTLPGNLVWDDITVDHPMGVGRDLGPGETFNVELTFQVVGCPPAEATPIRVKVVGAVDEDGQTVGRASDITNFPITCPSVTLIKRVAEPMTGIARVGDTVKFMIVVQNTGNQAISHLPLTDTFDSNYLGYVSATPAPDSTSPVGTLTWNNLAAGRPLRPGDRITVMVTMRAVGCPPAHAAENTAIVGGAIALHNGATYAVPEVTATASLEIPCPDLRVKKTVVSPNGDTVRPGDLVTFEITLENTGNKPLAVLPLDDIFDSQVLQFVSADPEPMVVIENLAQWDDLTGPAPNGFDHDLAPGETFTVTANFRVIGCPANQRALNEARVSGAIAIYQGLEWSVPQVSATARLTVEAGDIPCRAVSVTKRLVTPASGVAQPGDIATFEVVITNVGTQPIVALPLEDDFEPQYLEFVSASPQPESASLDPLRWLDLTSAAPYGFGRDLLPGETFTVNVRFRVVSCPLDEMTVNEARVAGAVAQKNGAEYPLPPALGSATLSIACPAGFRDLSVTKTLIDPASGVAQTGDLVTYRITLRATGYITISLLPLEDIFDLRYLEFVEASVTPDVVTPYLLQWDDLTGGDPFGFGRDLAPGEAFELMVTFRAIGCPPNQVTINTARVRGAAAIHNDIEEHYNWSMTRAATVRIACPALKVSKSLVPLACGIAGIGDPVRFNVVVENVGNTTLNRVTLVDTYSTRYLSFDAATPASSAHSMVNEVGTLTWVDLTSAAPEGFDRDLRPGEAFNVAVNFTAIASTQWSYPPVTVNVADVLGVDEYGFEAPDTAAAQVGVGVADADLFIEKTGPAETHPGGTITYQVRFGNNGPDSATYVRILEAIPAGTVFVDDTLCGRVNTGCFLGTLPAGFSHSFQVKVFVPFDVLPGTILENTVSIESGRTPSGPVCGIKDHDADNSVAGASSTVLADFGRANDPSAYSGDFTHEWLGQAVLGETSAPDVEEENDGWLNKLPWYRTNRLVELDVLVSTAGEGAARYGLADGRRLYLRGWLDRNRDGVFTDDELILIWDGGPGIAQWSLNVPTYRVKAQFSVPRVEDYTWVRFRLSYGKPPSPSGVEHFGEIEDHWVGFFSRDP